MSVITWNNQFELSNGPQSVTDISYQLKYIIKILERVAENVPMKIHFNIFNSRVTLINNKQDIFFKRLTFDA